MSDPMWTLPLRAEGNEVFGADGVPVAGGESVWGWLSDARAAAIAHALNRLPEAEAEIAALTAERDRLRADLAAAEALVAECAEYLKEGETPRQRMDRDHMDVLALMDMLAKDRTERDALRARLAPIVALAERIRQIVRNSEDSPAPIYTWMLHEISEDMAAAILAAGGQP